MKSNVLSGGLNFAFVSRSGAAPGVEEVRIRCPLRTKIRLLLFPKNLFSIDAWTADAATLDSAMLALGRIVGAHGETRSADELALHFAALEEAGSGLPRPFWIDLPRVRVTPAEEKGRWACYGVFDGGDAVTLFLSIGTEIPLGCILKSASTPSDSLRTAIGRLTLAHAEAFAPGRGSPVETAADLR